MDSLVGDITAMKAAQTADMVSIWALKNVMQSNEAHMNALLQVPLPPPSMRPNSTFDTYA